jgi:hypothetical protein
MGAYRSVVAGAAEDLGGDYVNWTCLDGYNSDRPSTMPAGYPRMRPCLGNDHIRGRTWRVSGPAIDSSAASRAAFKTGIHAYTYTSNGFRTQHEAPIPPP